MLRCEKSSRWIKWIYLQNRPFVKWASFITVTFTCLVSILNYCYIKPNITIKHYLSCFFSPNNLLQKSVNNIKKLHNPYLSILVQFYVILWKYQQLCFVAHHYFSSNWFSHQHFNVESMNEMLIRFVQELLWLLLLFESIHWSACCWWITDWYVHEICVEIFVNIISP